MKESKTNYRPFVIKIKKKKRNKQNNNTHKKALPSSFKEKESSLGTNRYGKVRQKRAKMKELIRVEKDYQVRLPKNSLLTDFRHCFY